MELNDPDNLAERVRNSALGSVARREHARGELRAKLLAKFSDGAIVDDTLDWLEQLNYLNDERFAEVFVRSSIAKGRGPVRIAQQMKQKGLQRDLIDEALEAAGVDWYELARELLERKFGEPARDPKAKARQVRYLQYRGFTGDQTFSVFD